MNGQPASATHVTRVTRVTRVDGAEWLLSMVGPFLDPPAPVIA